MQAYAHLAQILLKLDTAAPGLDAKMLFALVPCNGNTLPAAPSSGHENEPAMESIKPRELGGTAGPGDSTDSQTGECSSNPEAACCTEAAAAELAQHVNADNVTQLASVLDELQAAAPGSQPKCVCSMLCASHAYLLELCWAMQPFLDAPLPASLSARKKNGGKAVDVYEERVEYWSAMAPQDIVPAAAYLCFGPVVLHDMSSILDPTASLLCRLSMDQSSSQSQQPSSGEASSSRVQLESQQHVQSDDELNASLPRLSSSAAGGHLPGLKSSLQLTLRAGIARDAVAALRYQADGGMHTDSGASMQALDRLELMCQGLLAADDFCSAQSLSTRHADTVARHLARPSLSADLVKHANTASDLPMGVPQDASESAPAGGISINGAPAPHAPSMNASDLSSQAGTWDRSCGRAQPSSRQHEVVAGLKLRPVHPDLSRGPQLMACIQELAATRCPASALHRLITTCAARGIQLSLHPCRHERVSLSGQGSVAPASPSGLSNPQPSQDESYPIDDNDEVVSSFLVESLRDLAHRQLWKLADQQQTGRNDLEVLAGEGSRDWHARDGSGSQANDEPLQALESLLICLMNETDGGRLDSSKPDMASEPQHELPESVDLCCWLQFARDAVWEVLLHAALNVAISAALGNSMTAGVSRSHSDRDLPGLKSDSTEQIPSQSKAAAAETHPVPHDTSHADIKMVLPAQARATILHLLQQLQFCSDGTGKVLDIDTQVQHSRTPATQTLCWRGWQPPGKALLPKHNLHHQNLDVSGVIEQQLLLTRTQAALQAGWTAANAGTAGASDQLDAGLWSQQHLASLEAAAAAFEQLLGQAQDSAGRLRALSHILSSVWDHGHVFVRRSEVSPVCLSGRPRHPWFYGCHGIVQSSVCYALNQSL